MRPIFITLALMAATQSPVETAHAEYLTAVKAVPGFICMNLAVTHDQVVDRDFSVSVYSEPSLQSQKVGTATIEPFIKTPFRPEQKFQQMLRLNGDMAWIETKWLEPWSSPGHPNAKCTPSVMSDGRLGTSSK